MSILLAWDLETTGIGGSHRICQIGVSYLNLASGAELMTNSVLVNPGRAIPISAVAVHGISDPAVRNAPPLEDLWDGLCDHLEGHYAAQQGGQLSVVVAHNGEDFDWPFLERAAARLGLRMPAAPLRLDTLLLAWALFPGEARKLERLAEKLGVSLENAHDAAGDSRATALVANALINRAGGLAKAKSLEQMAAQSLTTFGKILAQTRAGLVWTAAGARKETQLALRGKPLTEVPASKLRELVRRNQAKPATIKAAADELARRAGGHQTAINVREAWAAGDVEGLLIELCSAFGLDPCSDLVWSETEFGQLRCGVELPNGRFLWTPTGKTRRGEVLGLPQLTVAGHTTTPAHLDEVRQALEAAR